MPLVPDVAQQPLCRSASAPRGERSRGDTRLRDWPDEEWQLVRDGKVGEHQADAKRFFKAYGRDVSVPEGLLDYDEDTRRLTLAGGTRWETAGQELVADVLGYLDAHPGASQRAILAALSGEKRESVKSAIVYAVNDGLVRQEPGPRNSTKHYIADPVITPAASAPSAPAVRRRTADECASAPIEGALHSLMRPSALAGALDWLPARMPSRRELVRGL